MFDPDVIYKNAGHRACRASADDAMLAAEIQRGGFKRVRAVFCWGSSQELIQLDTIASRNKSNEQIVKDVCQKIAPLEGTYESGTGELYLAEVRVNNGIVWAIKTEMPDYAKVP